jgi:hypothetical protein
LKKQIKEPLINRIQLAKALYCRDLCQNMSPLPRIFDDEEEEIGATTTAASVRSNPSLYCHNNNNNNNRCYCYCNSNDDNIDDATNQKGLSEPLLLPTLLTSNGDDNHRLHSRTYQTTTITTMITTIRLLLFIIFGYIIGTESAKMGLYVLLGYDDNDHCSVPFRLSPFHSNIYNRPYNNNESDDDGTVSTLSSSSSFIVSTTIRLQSLPYHNTVFVSLALALLWSASTIILTFISYQILQPILLRLQDRFLLRWQSEKDDVIIDFIRPSIARRGVNNVILDEKSIMDIDDDVEDVTNDDLVLDQEYNQLMITIGTCLGFTITCFLH